MSADKFTEEIKTRVRPSMRAEFDLLCNQSGEKDAVFARQIFKEYLDRHRAELNVLR